MCMYVFVCVVVGKYMQICVYTWRYVYKCNHSSGTIHAEDWGKDNLFKGVKVPLCLIPSVWT